MDDIIQWLAKGKDYAEGVRILDRHIRDRAFILYFKIRPSRTNTCFGA